MVRECADELTDTVLSAATRGHAELGPGLLESVYEQALAWELADHGFEVHCQVPIAARYRGRELGVGFRADIIVERRLLLELKCVECFNDVHIAQMITYLRLLGFKRGYLLNFNTRLLKHGIKRVSI